MGVELPADRLSVPIDLQLLPGLDLEGRALAIQGDRAFTDADAQRGIEQARLELGPDVAQPAERRADLHRAHRRVAPTAGVDVDAPAIERDRMGGKHAQKGAAVEPHRVSRAQPDGETAGRPGLQLGSDLDLVAGPPRRGGRHLDPSGDPAFGCDADEPPRAETDGDDHHRRRGQRRRHADPAAKRAPTDLFLPVGPQRAPHPFRAIFRHRGPPAGRAQKRLDAIIRAIGFAHVPAHPSVSVENPSRNASRARVSVDSAAFGVSSSREAISFTDRPSRYFHSRTSA